MSEDKKDKKTKSKPVLFMADPLAAKYMDSPELSKARQEVPETADPLNPFDLLMRSIKTEENKKAVRFAFVEDPNRSGQFAGIYKQRTESIPNHLIKRIIQQDDLVAAILNARGAFMSHFGRPRANRFDVGFVIEIRPDFKDKIDPEKMDIVNQRIERVKRILFNCGETKGLRFSDKMNLSTFFKMVCRDGLAYGNFCVEVVYLVDDKTGKKTFHRFRPVDAATIFKVSRKDKGTTAAANQLRDTAITALERLSGEKMDVKRFKRNEYAWIQVISGQPKQAFSEEDLIVANLYPVTNVEYSGYPLPPIENIINAVTTHINISNYNKLYFQSGRAAKGMVVFKSDDMDEDGLRIIKAQFHASVNSVQNSFRMPVFVVGKDDDVTWTPITTAAKRDGEFEYLSDANARIIISAFNMSPDELPGYGHLSRGTHSQALSESSNEYKLEASRSVGARPLILSFQDFLNDRILPLIDPELASLCHIVLAGLDAKTPEQEAIRLQEDGPLHMTMNDINEIVEKDGIPAQMAGDVPFNERWQVIADKYVYVGDFMEHFLGIPGASQNPLNKYKRDPFWFQYIQTVAQFKPELMEALLAVKPTALQDLKRSLLADDRIVSGDDIDEGEEEEE